MHREKQARLRAILDEFPSVCVAFSGGVDSSYLLYEAHRALGVGCTGVLTVSPAVPAWDREHARSFAAWLGVGLREIESRELENPDYVRNDPRRCFHCKAELGRILRGLAGETGAGVLVYGAVTDDLDDYRPGMEAARLAGIRAPLIEAGLSKADVRELSRRAGLPGWDRPASPCLASRLPYGTEVTADRLARVGAAEAALRNLGYRTLRVRHFGDTARLELGAAELELLATPGGKEKVEAAILAAGYTDLEIDRRGYRTGALNESLGPHELRK